MRKLRKKKHKSSKKFIKKNEKTKTGGKKGKMHTYKKGK